MATITDRIQHLAAQMPGVSLSDIAPLSLLDRMDTKYVLHEDQLCVALEACLPNYMVLEVNGVRPGRYETTYFDTADFNMYFSHHNGFRYRFKLRCRDYLDSRMTFVEVKMKNNKERMIKFRKQVPKPITSLGHLDRNWLPERFPYDFAEVVPVVWNRFRRMTIVNFAKQERITIDIDIHFGCQDRTITHQGMCVIEVKQSKYSKSSPLAQQLHLQHIHPVGISKFCVAAAHFYPGFKQNEFKPLLLRLNRLFPLRGSSDYAL
jgi:hypothetical protein